MNLAHMIDRMIAAGVSPGEAGALAAEIYAAGVSSVSDRSTNADRQQRYRDRKRNERNETVTDRNADIVTTSVTERNETVTSNAFTVSPIDTKIKNSKRQNSERASRGTRIDPNWTPNQADWQIAHDEGFSTTEIDREALRFRDYWTARAGSGGVKLDWQATWRNWVRLSAEKAGGDCPLLSPPSSILDRFRPGFNRSTSLTSLREAWMAGWVTAMTFDIAI